MTNPPPRERERDSSSPPVPNGPRSSTFQSRYRYTAEDSQHVSPDGLATLLDLYKHDDRNGRTRHQTSIYAEYWGKQNGAITLGVLHLAYSPDEGPMPDEPDHPDVMRAEYERIGAVLDWMIGERGRRGAVLTVVGQPGSGKSRFLRIERGRLFEAGRPCIVTDTSRATFDYYCDAGPFFDIPLEQLPHLGLLVPTVTLVDAANGTNRAANLQHTFIEKFIRNVVLVFATSPRLPRWYTLSQHISPILHWAIDGWPNNEIIALEKLLTTESLSTWTLSPRVRLQRVKRTERDKTHPPQTHLPPFSEVIRPASPKTQLELQHRLSIQPARSQRDPLPPPSAFFPEDAVGYYSQPAASNSAVYTLFEATYLLGRSVRLPVASFTVLYTFINEEAEQLVVVALQMTVSKRHSVNINGILPLYVALGRFASEAEFVYAFVTPDEETGRALVKPSRPALPAKSPVNSTRSSSSNAVEPFTWSRAFVVIDPKKPVQHVEAADD